MTFLVTGCELAIVAALTALPNRPDGFDEQAKTIAHAIDAATSSPIAAATLVAIGYYESGFLPRIQAGECYRWECDRGLSRGYWQIHRESRVREWNDLVGLDDDTVDLNARVVSRKLRGAFRVCHDISRAISYYAYGTCVPWPGAEKRVKLARWLEPQLAACS